MSELIKLVFKMIVCEGHSQKVIFKVKFTENVSLEGLPVSHTRLKWIDCKLYTYNANNFIFIINILIDGSVCHLFNYK